MDLNFLMNLLGIFGLVLIVISTILIELEKVKKYNFLILVFFGSFFLSINSYYFSLWTFFILNIFLVFFNFFLLIIKRNK